MQSPAEQTPWRALLFSTVVTTLLFAVALASMTSVLTSRASRTDLKAPRPQVTFLEPTPPAAPRPRERVVRKPASAAPSPVSEAPTVTPVVVPPADTAARIAAPSPSVRLTDTAHAPAAPDHSAIATAPVRGSAAAPAGLTVNSRAARGMATMTSRDSSLAVWARDAHELARWQTMSAASTGEIAQSRHEMEQLAQRVSTSGDGRDVHVMSGNGKDGVGAAGGGGLGGSIGLPLFSRGPSRAQRVRDSVTDADVRAGLALLAARVAAKRDSIRADSTRADSVRRLARSRKP